MNDKELLANYLHEKNLEKARKWQANKKKQAEEESLKKQIKQKHQDDVRYFTNILRNEFYFQQEVANDVIKDLNLLSEKFKDGCLSEFRTLTEQLIDNPSQSNTDAFNNFIQSNKVDANLKLLYAIGFIILGLAAIAGGIALGYATLLIMTGVIATGAGLLALLPTLLIFVALGLFIGSGFSFIGAYMCFSLNEISSFFKNFQDLPDILTHEKEPQPKSFLTQIFGIFKGSEKNTNNKNELILN